MALVVVLAVNRCVTRSAQQAARVVRGGPVSDALWALSLALVVVAAVAVLVALAARDFMGTVVPVVALLR